MESESQVTAAAPTDENGEDWREEVYQKILTMKEKYLTVLKELHRKIVSVIEELQSIHDPPYPAWFRKVENYRIMMRRIICFFLYVNKSQITPAYVDRLNDYESRIERLLQVVRSRRPVSISGNIKRVYAPRPIGAVHMQQARSQTTEEHVHE